MKITVRDEMFGENLHPVGTFKLSVIIDESLTWMEKVESFFQVLQMTGHTIDTKTVESIMDKVYEEADKKCAL